MLFCQKIFIIICLFVNSFFFSSLCSVNTVMRTLALENMLQNLAMVCFCLFVWVECTASAGLAVQCTELSWPQNYCYVLYYVC